MKTININSISIILLTIVFISPLLAQTLPPGKVTNIGKPINSEFDDFSPSLTADGKIMVFNSKRGKQYQDIYISTFENGKWTEPQPMNELNSPYNDETPFITPDGAFLFFASDRDGSFEMPANSSGQIKVSFDLYVSENINGQWRIPIKVPGGVNTRHHERSPSLSADSQTLFFSQWPFGDAEKAQIVMAAYRDGEFVNPEIMPAPVNIGAQDAGFVPSPDGKGFYFSSRRGGRGDWDIFYVSYTEGRFGEPVNLGNEINSNANEIYLSIIGNTMFFCSNRDGGLGLYDIYNSAVPEKPQEKNKIKIIVKDKKTKAPLSVDMNVSTKIRESDEKTATYEVKKKTDKNGEAEIQYNPQVRDMDIIIDKEGYLPFFKSIDVPQSKGEPQICELIPIEKEASFDIHSIHFDYESAKIKSESYPYLNTLADYLKKHTSMKFEIIGHTDLHGTDEFNNKLSRERAQAVKDYLVSRGLDEKRFSIRGAGKSSPKIPKIGPGFDEENRRTEFRLTEK